MVHERRSHHLADSSVVEDVIIFHFVYELLPLYAIILPSRQNRPKPIITYGKFSPLREATDSTYISLY